MPLKPMPQSAQPSRIEAPRAAVTWLLGHAAPGAALRSDSRQLRAGDVFMAWPGRHADGRAYLARAFEAGCSAALIEADGAQAHLAGLPPFWQARVVLYPGLQQASGIIAAQWWGQPAQDMAVVAVTGTNGKTSVSWWLAHLLQRQWGGAGLVGTLGVGALPALHATGLTSPDALQLQSVLHGLRQAGVRACAMEASSIGLEQGRLNGTPIRVAVFTNLTQDHLDYHGSMSAYGQAKRILFGWPGLEAAVINVEDAFGAVLTADVGARGGVDLWTYATADDANGGAVPAARLVARALRFAGGGVAFQLDEYASADSAGAGLAPLASVAVQAPLAGRFNVMNVLAVIGSLRALGLPLAAVATLCAALPAVPGRMQASGGTGQPLVVVDYAHTPDALASVLAALRPVAAQRGGRLFCVFGCGGDRDAGKRPLMAQAAASHADALWITSDNPRSENPLDIISQIEAGLAPQQRAGVRTEPDRRRAILAAVAAAAEPDVVLVAGKGHEDYQDVQGVRRHFSDLEEAKAALAHWTQPQELSA
ncbi:UDP-N-acetylmuramoyl-L-alanyl-D-glutamate--2,6-diaminopimelate ligase [Corticibacter populi]